MKKIIAIALFFISEGNCFAQQVTFHKSIGGTSNEVGFWIHQSADGGYIITGSTYDLGVTSPDVYFNKIDSNGNLLWTKTYGGAINADGAYSTQQTTDGGYIITGWVSSFGAGDNDVYLIKVDQSGNLLWTKTFGGIGSDWGHSVKQTTDGGYIICGNTNSFGAGDYDVYLIKTDSNGDSLWTRTFGGIDIDYGYSVQQTTDGGYIIVGTTYSSIFSGSNVVYLIKINVTGNILWSKIFGGTGAEWGRYVQQTTDGGYIIAGYTYSFGAGLQDIYLVKTNVNGNLVWTKTYGGINDDGGYSIQQTTDGGYIITGYTYSFGAGNADVYLVKIDANGDSIWTKTLGGGISDYGNAVQQTTDGGYIITGQSGSFGAGNWDVYLIKTDSLGNSGCNEGSTATIVTTPATQVSSPATIVTSPATIVTTPATIVGSGGTVTTLCTTVGIPSAIPNLPSVITISPNPTTNNFTITFPNTNNKGMIEIYNVLGEKIFEENVFNVSQKEIHLKNSVAGIYFVKVRDGEKEYCGKLVIE